MYLVTIYWDEDSPLSPLIGLIYWIRALILIIPVSGGTQVQREEMPFTDPLKIEF